MSRDRERSRQHVVPCSLGVGVILSALVGCSSPLPEVADDATGASARGGEILDTVRSRDESRIPRLVEELDSDDVLYRWMAIRSLKDLTGEDLGYRYDAEPAAREDAIRRWVAYVDQRGLRAGGSQ